MSKWLDINEWRHIQGVMPILCVDLLVIKNPRPNQEPEAIGLIYRDTPHQGERWCLIGGRLFRDEDIVTAIRRQISETLGDLVQFELGDEPQPIYVAQYFPIKRNVGGVDPRQHAIGLTYCIEIRGEFLAQGEARAFSWFHPAQLPDSSQFGFDQDRVVTACLAQLTMGAIKRIHGFDSH